VYAQQAPLPRYVVAFRLKGADMYAMFVLGEQNKEAFTAHMSRTWQRTNANVSGSP
jgi:hypothetical protein